MEINFIIDQIIKQFAIWMPSIASILGTVIVLINSKEKLKGAINDMKTASVELKSDTSIKELIAALKQQSVENETLKRQNRLILEQLTKVKNYDIIKSAYAEVPNESSNKKIQETQK